MRGLFRPARRERRDDSQVGGRKAVRPGSAPDLHPGPDERGEQRLPVRRIRAVHRVRDRGALAPGRPEHAGHAAGRDHPRRSGAGVAARARRTDRRVGGSPRCLPDERGWCGALPGDRRLRHPRRAHGRRRARRVHLPRRLRASPRACSSAASSPCTQARSRPGRVRSCSRASPGRGSRRCSAPSSSAGMRCSPTT